MRFNLVIRCLPALLVLAGSTHAQQSQEKPAYVDSSLRLFLDGDIGVSTQLGYLPPSSDFGASFEYPRWRQIELQGTFSYSPDRKKVPGNGNSILASGTIVAWPSSRVGVLGELDAAHLWTSQFKEGGVSPVVGVVARTHLLYPGRFYITYTFATGCVWATPSNPCTLQSKRLQGPTFRQEFQIRPSVRIGVEVGAYHFCAQSNQNEPTVPRSCSWAVTDSVFLRFQFRGLRTGNAY
jgi:hypothetical protein